MNPFFWLPDGWPRYLSLIVLGAAVGSFVYGLTVQGKPLSREVRGGIVAFELAWTTDRAQKILDAWKSLVPTALTQLHWDFGFLIVYSLFGSLTCAALAQAQNNRWPWLGNFFSWAMLVAGALDACEDFALIRMLKTQSATEFLTKTASFCASVKFLILIAGLVYVIVQGIALLRN